MNRAELVDAIAEKTGSTAKDADRHLTALFDVVADVVGKKGDKITVPGYASFEKASRAARTGRNPQTGETIKIAASKTVKIKTGSKLKASAV